MFGNGFGAESDARDAQRHSTGRRHGPREMSDTNASASTVTLQAQREHDSRRAQQALNMQKAPSFLEQMYNGDAARGGAAQERPNAVPPSKRHGGGGDAKEALNVFAWENKPHNDAVPQRGRIIERSDAELRSLRKNDDSGKRDGDAKKFSGNTDNNFLRFSDQPQTNTRKPLSPQNNPVPYAVDYPQTGVPTTDANTRPMKRRAPPAKDGGGPDVQGFPGMGKASPHKPMDHLERRGQESTVFLPPPPGGEMPMASRADPEAMQRMHQQRVNPEVGAASHTPQPRNNGPYTTSNGSYGVKSTPQSMTPQSMTPQAYQPYGGYPPQGMTPQSMTPQAYQPYGGYPPQGMTPQSMTPQAKRPPGAYQPPSLPPGARPAQEPGHGDGCECCPPRHQNPAAQYPPLYPESESSTPRYLRDHDEYAPDAMGPEERDLYEYEQQLRMRLMKAREVPDSDSVEAARYDFSESKGIMETPREDGAKWLDEPAGDRRVRFNM